MSEGDERSEDPERTISTVSEGDERSEDPERSINTVSEGDERSAELEPSEGREPVLRVVRGEPTDEELAALVAVVTARSAAARAGAEEPPRSQWRNRSRNIRPAIGPSANAWRASGLPR